MNLKENLSEKEHQGDNSEEKDSQAPSNQENINKPINKNSSEDEEQITADNQGQEESEIPPPTYEELKKELTDLIAEARDNSGRSNDDIAYQINIPVSTLSKMSDGSAYEQIEKVFLRGYLVNYAKALGEEPSIYTELLEQMLAAKEAEANDDNKTKGKAKHRGKFNERESDFDNAYDMLDESGTRKARKVEFLIPLCIVLICVGGLVYWRFFTESGQLDRSTEITNNIEAPAFIDSALEDENGEQDDEPVDSATRGSGSETQEEGDPNEIEFTFLEESWLEVNDQTGNRLTWQLYGPGQSVAFRGSPPFNLIVGNAQGVLVDYLGEEINLRSFGNEENVAILSMPLNEQRGEQGGEQ